MSLGVNGKDKVDVRLPFRIFSRIVLIQSIIILLTISVAGFALRHLIRKELIDAGVAADRLITALSHYDSLMVAFLIILSFILTGFALWTGKLLVFPVSRILLKAQSVLNQDEQRPGRIEEIDQENPETPYEEWSDLETSLEHIRKDLNTKIESLTLQSEEQATLMSAISDAILAVDADGSPLFYNSRFALLFGMSELQKRQRLWEMFREPEILDAFRGALKDGRHRSVKGIPFTLPFGQEQAERKYFSISVAPLRKGHDETYGAVGIFHDVTDLKRAEQMRIDFVANVSHELRTPLTAIKGYADTLMLDIDQGAPIEKDYLQVIVRNTDRLMSLINDLLDLSSLESSDTLQKSEIQTEEFTRRIVGQLKGGIEAKHHQLTVKTDAPVVMADPRRLEQVLVNLLDNANKYTVPGGKISVTWETEKDRAVRLRIWNSGAGIPVEHHSRLFERFYRVDKGRSRELGGTGLGLAIVKHIMQRHDGNIWVESAPGMGTTFVCRFPNTTTTV